jgi:hypothetical protein
MNDVARLTFFGLKVCKIVTMVSSHCTTIVLKAFLAVLVVETVQTSDRLLSDA